MIYDFAGMVLTKKPKYVKRLLIDFPTFSAKETKLIYTALLASNNKEAANENRNKFTTGIMIIYEDKKNFKSKSSLLIYDLFTTDLTLFS